MGVEGAVKDEGGPPASRARTGRFSVVTDRDMIGIVDAAVGFGKEKASRVEDSR